MTSPAQDAGFSNNAQVGAVVTPCAADKRNLVLIPRKKANLYGPENRIKDLLKSYPSFCGASPLRALEYNFYPDLNAERTITAVLTEDPWSPHGDARPALKSGSINFELVGAAAGDFEITPASASGNEVEIKLKVKKFYQEDKLKDHSTIKIKATSSGHTAELELKVHRNEDVGTALTQSNDDIPAALGEITGNLDGALAEVLDKRTLLVRQASEYVSSKGVMAMQVLLNQVVARHKAVGDDFKWLEFDGMYGSGGVGADLKAFLSHFAGAFDYPHGHFNVAVDQELIDYVKAEYGAYAPGDIVDRAVLVGKERWTADKSYTQADGLLDIYEAVVLRLMDQMQDLADDYTTAFSTFWLHYPAHKKYEAGDAVDDELVVVSDTLNVRAGAGTNKAAVASVTRGATLARKGGQETVAGQVWYEVETPDGTLGWCSGSASLVRKLTKDRDKSTKNAGNHGDPGVCYALGGKDRPDAFAARLTDNATPPDSIQSWYQYVATAANGQPGIDPDAVSLPGNGCDCSGFVQNCITQSTFSDGTRVASDAIVKRIDPQPQTPSWPWNNCIGAKDFVGHYSRQIPYTAHNEGKQFLDKTDVITSLSHIVWVADRHPKIKHPSQDRDFMVFNEYGGDTYEDESQPPDDRFIRKAIKMAFHHWGIVLNGSNKKMGRIYLWS
jgi:SH3 domain-containing protein